MSNMYEPDYEPLVTFKLELTPAEMGMLQVALRFHARHVEKQREAFAKKFGDIFDSTESDEKAETIKSMQRKIRKAGYG
jgi:uncharacterized protein YaaR (DUF327 family)